ncbi:MAG: DUF1214 domain-containing protein [Hyphomicrobiales bacterium]|nr:DUF1214 domain-containing protein [Hyphomicrobiales bacterium]
MTVGATSAWYSIQRSHGIGAINIGVWTAWPYSGANQADPYTLARITSDSTLPLGAAEGLAFEATRDDDGAFLKLECNYILEGNTPKAKLWSLTPYRQDGKSIQTEKDNNLISYHTNSTRLLRYADGTFQIALGPIPSPGNWLATRGNGVYRLVLRLYDTPIASNTGIADPIMPKIINIGCPQ